MPEWVDAVKVQYGGPGVKYVCVGYCFGAPYVCDLLGGDTVVAGAFAHPAFLKERHFAQIRSRLVPGDAMLQIHKEDTYGPRC